MEKNKSRPESCRTNKEHPTVPPESNSSSHCHSMYPWSSSSSSRAAAAAETSANVVEGSEEAGAEQAAAGATSASSGSSSSSSSPPLTVPLPVVSYQAAGATADGGGRPSSPSFRSHHTVELVEQRLRSSWGRPVHPVPSPTSVGGEPSRMHQMIAKIGSGASAGIVLPVPVPPPPTTSSSASSSGTPVEDQQQQNNVESSSSSSSLSAEWRAIEERCKTRAHEAAHLDRRGRTCLHAACAKKPPVSTIEAILKAMTTTGNSITNSNNSGAEVPILLERDKHGRTPLLIAIASHHADLQVIAFLLQKSPKAAAVSDHLGNLPLMVACEATGGGGYNDNPVVQVQLVRLLLLAFPQAAQRESLNGCLALHIAVECNAPAAVVAQLVQVYPQAVICDGCGLNPLFLAIRYNVSVQTIQTLVAACPEATLTRDRGRGMPLRRAIENQSPLAVQACLCTCPLVVLDADIHVHNTALHTALEYGATTLKLATVKLMLRMAPQLAMTVSKSGQTPLTLACQQWQRFRDSLRHRQSIYEEQQLLLATGPAPVVGANNSPSSAAIHALEAHCRRMWLMIITLMKAAFYGVIDDPIVRNIPTLTTASSLRQEQQQDNHGYDDNGNDLLTLQSALHQQHLHVLHAAVSLPQLPLTVVIHALELYAQDASTRNDPSGRYPLQLCILTSQPPQQPSQLQEASQHPAMAAAAAIQRYNHEKNLFLLKEQVILKTLHVLPQATQLPDFTGRLALSLAAQQATSISATVLQELWSHHPAALATLDPVWRLYPFQIAAVQKEQPQPQQQRPCQQGGTTATTTTPTSQGGGVGVCWKEMQDLLQLSAIFLLLKQRPDLIHLHLCKS